MYISSNSSQDLLLLSFLSLARTYRSPVQVLMLSMFQFTPFAGLCQFLPRVIRSIACEEKSHVALLDLIAHFLNRRAIEVVCGARLLLFPMLHSSCLCWSLRAWSCHCSKFSLGPRRRSLAALTFFLRSSHRTRRHPIPDKRPLRSSIYMDMARVKLLIVSPCSMPPGPQTSWYLPS